MWGGTGGVINQNKRHDKSRYIDKKYIKQILSAIFFTIGRLARRPNITAGRLARRPAVCCFL